MSKVIQVLTQMASDATLINPELLTKMLFAAEISQKQQQAIIAKDIDALTDAIHDLPVIRCVPILIPDDEEQVITIVSQTAVNF